MEIDRQILYAAPSFVLPDPMQNSAANYQDILFTKVFFLGDDMHLRN